MELSLVILRRALDQAAKWGLVGRNVAKLVDSPKVERYYGTAFTGSQARTFLSRMQGERFEALYLIALGIGLRQGELLGLRWQDVDFTAHTIAVRQVLARIGGKRFGAPGNLQLVEPKTASSRRTVSDVRRYREGSQSLSDSPE